MPTLHVLFAGCTHESDPEAHAELLRVIPALGLGLELVETPTDTPTGSIWVRTDPRFDLELEKW